MVMVWILSVGHFAIISNRPLGNEPDVVMDAFDGQVDSGQVMSF
jgi:hypothetical protein